MSGWLTEILLFAKPALFNIYFTLLALPLGFPIAIGLALGRNSHNQLIRWLCRAYIYAFRGSPLFVQFFLIYSIFLAFNLEYWKPMGINEWILHPLFIGPLVLMLNSAAYTAHIFCGALRNIPHGEVEAAKALGLSQRQTFKTVQWPNMLRLAWPSYTNEAVFLFQATSLVYFTLPVINGQKDLMRQATYLFEKDYALFLHFGVAGLYFLVISLAIFYIYNRINYRLNRHLTDNVASLKIRPKFLR